VVRGSPFVVRCSKYELRDTNRDSRLTNHDVSIAELRQNVKEAKMETILERKKYNSKILTTGALAFASQEAAEAPDLKCFVEKTHRHFDRSSDPSGRSGEIYLRTDFSTRPAEGGLDPVQGFALLARSK